MLDMYACTRGRTSDERQGLRRLVEKMRCEPSEHNDCGIGESYFALPFQGAQIIYYGSLPGALPLATISAGFQPEDLSQ